MIPIYLLLIYLSKDFFIVGSLVFDGLPLLICADGRSGTIIAVF